MRIIPLLLMTALFQAQNLRAEANSNLPMLGVAGVDFELHQMTDSPIYLKIPVRREEIPVEATNENEFWRKCSENAQMRLALLSSEHVNVAYYALTYGSTAPLSLPANRLVGLDLKKIYYGCALYYLTEEDFEQHAKKDKITALFHKKIAKRVFYNPWNNDETISFVPSLVINSMYESGSADTKPKVSFAARLELFSKRNDYTYNNGDSEGVIEIGHRYNMTEESSLHEINQRYLQQGFNKRWEGFRQEKDPGLFLDRSLISIAGTLTETRLAARQMLVYDIMLSAYEDEQTGENGTSDVWLEYTPTHYKAKGWTRYGWYKHPSQVKTVVPLVERKEGHLLKIHK